MVSETVTNSAEETIAAGERFSALLKPFDIVVYDGRMGAGKTHFTKGIAKGLGCGDVVTSPTYTIVNEYRGGRLPLWHFDLYRLTSEDDLFATGFYDYLDQGGVMCIEWAQKIDGLLRQLTEYRNKKANVTIVSIETLSPEKRRIRRFTAENGTGDEQKQC